MLIFIFGAVIAIQSPKVQLFLAGKAVEALNKHIDGDIVFDEISLLPFNALVLKNVSVIDRSPYINDSIPGFEKTDTLFNAGHITATFGLKGLFMQNGLHLRTAKIRDASFTLVTEPSPYDSSGRVNLSRIFRIKSSSDTNDVKDNEIFNIAKVEIHNLRFRLKNPKTGFDIPEDAINWGDLDVTLHRLKGRGLKMKGPVMQGIADDLSFTEKSGYKVEKISGRAKVGNGRTLITDVSIKDLWSDIKSPRILMTYKDTKSWSDFINSVMMDIKVEKSRVNLHSVSYFAPTLKNRSMTAEISAHYKGYINDFSVTEIKLRALDSEVYGKAEGSIIGLPDSQGMMTDISLQDFNFTLEELEKCLKGWIPNADIPIGRFAPGERLNFNGRMRGPLNRLKVKGYIDSEAGSVDALLDIRNLIDPARPPIIGGNIATNELHLGRVFNIKDLGRLSMRSGLSANLDTKGKRVIKLDSLKIDKLVAHGYEYSGIAASGIYENDAFNGKIVCRDPNLNFLFQGVFSPSSKTKNAIYQFYANLGYADLHALNLDKREKSKLSLKTMANFRVLESSDIIGNIDIKDIVLEDAGGTHEIGEIAVSSHVNENINRIKLKSSFAEGSYVGSGFLDAFLKDLKALTAGKETPALFKKEIPEASGNDYKVSLSLHDTRDILAFLMPGFYIADSTYINVDINKNGGLQGKIKSRRLAYLDKYIKGVNLKLGNEGDELSAELSASEINASPFLLKNNRMLMYARDNNVGLGFSYDNETEASNSGEIYMRGSLERRGPDSLSLKAEMLPSNIYFQSDAWSIGNSNFSLDKKGIRIEDLLIRNNSQSIRLKGGYSSTVKDSLNLSLEMFDLSILNSLIKKNLDLKGTLSGDAVLTSPAKKGWNLQMKMKCDSSYFAGKAAGTVNVQCESDSTGKAFILLCKNKIGGKKTFDGLARLVPGRKTSLDGRLILDSLNLGYAKPFLTDIFHVMEGDLSGGLRFSGPLSRLNIKSEGLNIRKGLLGVDFTKVVYNVEGKADIDSTGVSFRNIGISDRFGSKGAVNGKIRWRNFKNISFDTEIALNEMEALNISESGNPGFYGNVFATGRLKISGPIKALVLDADVSTAKDGSFHVPMTQAASSSSSDLLTFKEPEKKVYIDPYEAMMAVISKKAEENSLNIKLHINVDQGTEARIEIDKDSGNVLTGRGNGIIDIDIRPSENAFGLNGNYNISSGKYHFEALGIVRRDFTIQNGSSIKFNGDIMKSELDIKALYKTKTAIGPIIADTSATTRRTVECIISLRDRLSSPRVGFAINIPDLDPTTKALVDNALSTNDKVQKQFLSLLISNSFLPDERSGIVNNASMLNTTVTEIMANQLNSILQTLNIPLDLGLGYQNNKGSDIFDVALSTALFDNRVIVNGTIGNRQYRTSTSRNEFVGDLDIAIKIDKPGALRLTLFSHSADQYSNYLDNSQRNGVGLTYQREFSNIKEFLRNLFKGRKKRKEENAALERARQTEEKVKLSIENKKDGK